jgi:hypothetical protein
MVCIAHSNLLVQLRKNAASSGDGFYEPERATTPKLQVTPLRSREITASTTGLNYGFSQIPAMAKPSPLKRGTWWRQFRGFIAM